jgi:hypothetical protein
VAYRVPSRCTRPLRAPALLQPDGVCPSRSVSVRECHARHQGAQSSFVPPHARLSHLVAWTVLIPNSLGHTDSLFPSRHRRLSNMGAYRESARRPASRCPGARARSTPRSTAPSQAESEASSLSSQR